MLAKPLERVGMDEIFMIEIMNAIVNFVIKLVIAK